MTQAAPPRSGMVLTALILVAGLILAINFAAVPDMTDLTL